MPHSAPRLWRLMQDYEKWPEFAKPMVTGIDVVSPGDKNGNGLVRRVNYKLPLGFKGTSTETISKVKPGVSYTYTSLKGTVGHIFLERIDAKNTRLHFEENLKLNWPFSWFQGRLQKFMEKYNRRTMMNMSTWLIEHPDY